MRLKYAITSDIEDVSRKMKFHLELYRENNNLDEKLNSIMEELNSERIVRTLEDIDLLRQEIGKLDLLLSEISGVLSAVNSAHDDLEPEVEPEPVVPPPEREQKAVVSDKASALQATMNQLTNITSALADMKKQ